MIHTVFHNYKDDELIRYALSAIHHPAVIEICQRVSLLDFELSEHDQVSDLKEELAQANSQIDCLEEKIEILKEDISNNLNYIKSLEADLEEANAIPN